MAFDPDAYLAKKSSGGFDPDAYLAKRGGGGGGGALPAIPQAKGTLLDLFKRNVGGATGLRGASQVASDPGGAAVAGLKALPVAAGIGAGIATGGLGVLPAMGASALGGAGGEALRQLGMRALGKEVPKTSGEAAKGILKEAAINAGGEVGGRGLVAGVKAIGKGAKNLGVRMAKTSIFQKSKLYSSRSPTETLRKIARADKTSEAMLEQGLISKTGDVGETVLNVQKMKSAADGQMNAVIDALDAKVATQTIDDFSASIRTNLPSQFPGQESSIGEIVKELDTFRAPKPSVSGGRDPFLPKTPEAVNIRDLQKLKKRWGDKGYEMLTVNTDAARAYRRASDMADKLISETIKKHGGEEALKRYTAAKGQEAVAFNAMSGLSERLAAEQGNVPFSLASLGANLSRRAFRAASPIAYGAGKRAGRVSVPGVTSAIKGIRLFTGE